jgi:hypothetical protein
MVSSMVALINLFVWEPEVIYPVSNFKIAEDNKLNEYYWIWRLNRTTELMNESHGESHNKIMDTNSTIVTRNEINKFLTQCILPDSTTSKNLA